VDEKGAMGSRAAPKSRTNRKAKTGIEEFFTLGIVIPPMSSVQRSSDTFIVINIGSAVN
jgi:hypothetical protein